MMEVLFWGSAAVIAYVYAGYPVCLALWSWVVRAFNRADAPDAAEGGAAGVQLPGVSVIIAARNEAARLPDRIENLLQSDYPLDRLQIIVSSDGSTDRTPEVLAPYRSRIELLTLPPAGKAQALNAAVARARHPILVFADARQRFAPDAIRRLVQPFSRLSVGAVSGELVLDCEGVNSSDGAGSTIGDGIGLYWRYEKWLRRHESIVGSTLGVTGAIYAMRRSLWTPLPPDTILDDVLGPMRLVLRGYRVLFDARALAFDETAPDAASETRRKIRTLAGNYQLVALEPRLLLPWVNPVWLQFVSHKLGRLVVPYALVTVLVANAWIASLSILYTLAFAAQAAFYGAAVYGAWLDRRDAARASHRSLMHARHSSRPGVTLNRHEAA